MLNVNGVAQQGHSFDNVQEGTFALSKESAAWQIGIHLNNMKTFYSKGHPDYRQYKISQILEYINFIIFTDSVEEHLADNNSSNHLSFRCAQLVSHYGADIVKDYINLVYAPEQEGALK